MDLCYNGQYRMVELSKFLFFSHMTDEIPLLSDILEKLAQVKVIIYIDSIQLYVTNLPTYYIHSV